jgi:hypothetical protein
MTVHTGSLFQTSRFEGKNTNKEMSYYSKDIFCTFTIKTGKWILLSLN